MQARKPKQGVEKLDIVNEPPDGDLDHTMDLLG
jgi:hypothetical protein